MSQKPRISFGQLADEDPNTFTVFKHRGEWAVKIGPVNLGRFPTHTQAINHATQQARHHAYHVLKPAIGNRIRQQARERQP